MDTAEVINILLLEDRPTDAAMILREVSREGLQFTAKRVMTETEFEAGLQNPEVDLVLSDFKLPSYDGLSALKRAQQLRPEVPFIMVSGTMGEELAINSLHLGAVDYVLKERLSRLGPAVRRALRESRLANNEVRTESLIRHLHEVLRAVRDVDKLIVRERNPETLLAEACKVLVRTRGYRVVWIGLVGTDSKRVVPAASAGPAAGYPHEITVTWDESKTGRGPVGMAIRRRTTCVFQNLAQNARFGPWHEKALAHGCHSVAAVPMMHGDRLWGSLNVYADRPNAFNQEELDLLKELADDLALALQNIEIGRHHQRAEAEMARLVTAVEQAAETIVITDTRGTILYVNPAFERITGYTTEEALGQNPRLLKSGKQDTEFYRNMWAALMRGEVWHGRFVNKRKDGTLYEEDATISPVRDASGRVVNYIALKLDVTREARLEQQLRQAQKLEAIGQLAGGVAHDFNNILTGFMMNLCLLQRAGRVEPEAHAIIADLEAGAVRASNLTRQLLAFSRRSIMEVRALDLNKVVSGVFKMLKHLLGEHIDIHFKPSGPLPFVEADAGMMEQILINLAVNARDAMPGGGRITITTGVVEVDTETADRNPNWRRGRHVCLSVMDTGCGMDEATMKRIFEPFFTTKEKDKGTGLGLATVYGIVAQHRGWVDVESRLTRGSTFRVFLPSTANMPLPEKQQGTRPVPRGHETLLVVEDAPDVRRALVQTLRVLGYRVLEAADGKQALTLWNQHHPEISLLLTDMVMPGGMSGLELANKIREQKPGLKNIISSGYSTDLAHREPLADGVTYLPKPYQASLLGRVVRDCLDGYNPSTQQHANDHNQNQNHDRGRSRHHARGPAPHAG
jgi:PAS domain S-box-containing protein